MKLSDFSYDLPPELIAQAPLEDRSASRMLVVHRESGLLEDRHFRDLPDYLMRGDCVVLNDSRVFPSRLYGTRASGGKAEVFLLKQLEPRLWTALVKPGRSLQPGARIFFERGPLPDGRGSERAESRFSAEVVDRGELGLRTIRFHCPIEEL